VQRIILASASPRRAELLRAAGFDFDIMPADVDETVDVEETPDGYARRVALAKTQTVLPRADGRPVLGADTVVVVDTELLGKPAGDADAKRMLRMLSGRDHVVLTAVCIASQPAGESRRMLTRLERTTVRFAPISDEEIDWYVASGEPRDKAGAYAIQGLASRFVTRIDGSYSNVVGLPISLVYQMLRAGAPA
jgi:septum formation protein